MWPWKVTSLDFQFHQQNRGVRIDEFSELFLIQLFFDFYDFLYGCALPKLQGQEDEILSTKETPDFASYLIEG